MITHDIDEAILLSNKIVLMTAGPNARVCEIVENTLPVDRTRSDIHRHPNYGPMRNHLLEFLVNRSWGSDESGAEVKGFPGVVRPVADNQGVSSMATEEAF